MWEIKVQREREREKTEICFFFALLTSRRMCAPVQWSEVIYVSVSNLLRDSCPLTLSLPVKLHAKWHCVHPFISRVGLLTSALQIISHHKMKIFIIAASAEIEKKESRHFFLSVAHAVCLRVSWGTSRTSRGQNLFISSRHYASSPQVWSIKRKIEIWGHSLAQQ